MIKTKLDIFYEFIKKSISIIYFMIKYHCWTTYEYFHPCYLRICHLNVLHVARFKVIITFWLTFNGFFVNVLWYLWHGTCQKSVVASSFHLFFCYQRSYSMIWNVHTSFLFTNEYPVHDWFCPNVSISTKDIYVYFQRFCDYIFSPLSLSSIPRSIIMDYWTISFLLSNISQEWKNV